MSQRLSHLHRREDFFDTDAKTSLWSLISVLGRASSTSLLSWQSSITSQLAQLIHHEQAWKDQWSAGGDHPPSNRWVSERNAFVFEAFFVVFSFCSLFSILLWSRPSSPPQLTLPVSVSSSWPSLLAFCLFKYVYQGRDLLNLQFAAVQASDAGGTGNRLCAFGCRPTAGLGSGARNWNGK